MAAIIDYAAKVLAATDIFARITHGNDRSVKVAKRTGFDKVATFTRYDWYHRPIASR